VKRIDNNIFIIAMTRTIIVKGKEYYVITTSMQVDGIEAPIQVHVNVSNLDDKAKDKIQRHSNYFFNRIFKSIQKPKEQLVKKAWYKFW
jgi:sulfate adenylyltransferase subunit 1 (EFTu-like GTPase family)